MRTILILGLLGWTAVAAEPRTNDKNRFEIIRETTDNGSYSPTILLDTTNGETWRLCKENDEPSSWMWCRVDRQPSRSEMNRMFEEARKRMARRAFSSQEEKLEALKGVLEDLRVEAGLK